MSQPAVKGLDLPFELVYSDGIPLDSHRQRIQMNLLIGVIRQAMAARGREDFFAGGNMFVYDSMEQARDVAKGKRHFRGPDVFFVDHVAPKQEERKAWGLVGRRGPAAGPDRGDPVAVDREDRPEGQAEALLPGVPHPGLLPLQPGHVEAGRLPAGRRPLSADPSD